MIDIPNKSELSEKIKTKAKELGFFNCGIARAEKLEKEAAHLDLWLKNNYNASMQYMERNFSKRINPSELFQNTKSVVSVLYNYFTEEKPAMEYYKISSYAYGTDYHFVLKDKLKELIKFIGKYVPDLKARAFVDSAPVMDKVWAVKGGLGWIGKNTCLINSKSGSYFFIGEIVLNVELDYNDQIQNDLCGTCTRCIKACPTQALIEPYVLDAGRCISYQTIENKASIPDQLKSKFENYIFGCDICQQVCPWNRFAIPHEEPLFKLNDKLKNLDKENCENMTKAEFNSCFKNSAVKRAGFEKLKSNISFINEDPE